MLFSTPSTRMARPHCLHSNACASDSLMKPPQLGHGTSWSVLIAATRTALDLRPERNRGPSCRSAGMGECSLIGAERSKSANAGDSWPQIYVPRRGSRECDIQHKIAFLNDLTRDIGAERPALTPPPERRASLGESRRRIHSARAPAPSH
jgi:hypothetical protein